MPSTIERIRRMFSHRAPEMQKPPVNVHNSFPTFALAVDNPVPVPRDLIHLAMDAVRMCADAEVTLEDLLKRDGFPDWMAIWPGEHYLLLMALVKRLQPRVIIEIGTDTGMSALAMRKYQPAGGHLVTFDIVPWREVEDEVLRDADFADGALEQRLADLSDPAEMEKHRALLESADFFFIDAPKDGVFEYKLLENFKRLRFAKPPVMLWDDTLLPSMLRFWSELSYPKVDLTGLGHWSGTGLMQWTA